MSIESEPMKRRIKAILQWTADLRKSSRFRSLLLFLTFVLIASLFWLIMTLNDSVQTNVQVNLKITNKPDSVTFISDVPKTLHVEVADKGTGLMRVAWLHTPTVNLSFPELASDGQLVCSRTDMMSAIKTAFGGSATIISSSIDSLRLLYTDRPGKNVPVQVSLQTSAKAGFMVYGAPKCEPPRVTVYGPREILDTLTRVFTKTYVEQNLSESRSFTADLAPIKGARIIPSKVSVKINVEPLVAKEEMITVVSENVPSGENLLLFPSKVHVAYYVPMSEFSSERSSVKVTADYHDVSTHRSARLPLHIEISDGSNAVRPTLHSDSVEYTLIKGN